LLLVVLLWFNCLIMFLNFKLNNYFLLYCFIIFFFLTKLFHYVMFFGFVESWFDWTCQQWEQKCIGWVVFRLMSSGGRQQLKPQGFRALPTRVSHFLIRLCWEIAVTLDDVCCLLHLPIDRHLFDHQGIFAKLMLLS
jgi:hypothetical protein